jgi:hypothetical protein
MASGLAIALSDHRILIQLTLGTGAMLEASLVDRSGNVVLWKLDLMGYLEVDLDNVRSRDDIMNGKLSAPGTWRGEL